MKTKLTFRNPAPAIALLAWLLLPQTGHSFYNPSTGRWLSRDPLNDPALKFTIPSVTAVNRKAEVNLYQFVGSDPIQSWDYLGLDNPGCDLPPDVMATLTNAANKDCVLRACAKHDACYFKYRCTKSSWQLNAGMCACPLLVCCMNRHERNCAACNCAVVTRIGLCGAGDNGEGDRWFCPNGPNRGSTYDNYDDIPASCWEDGHKPPPQ